MKNTEINTGIHTRLADRVDTDVPVMRGLTWRGVVLCITISSGVGFLLAILIFFANPPLAPLIFLLTPLFTVWISGTLMLSLGRGMTARQCERKFCLIIHKIPLLTHLVRLQRELLTVRGAGAIPIIDTEHGGKKVRYIAHGL